MSEDFESGDLRETLSGENLRIGGMTLMRAVDITGDRPRTYRLAKRDGEPLYALPGGTRATVKQIIVLLKKPKKQEATNGH